MRQWYLQDSEAEKLVFIYLEPSVLTFHNRTVLANKCFYLMEMGNTNRFYLLSKDAAFEHLNKSYCVLSDGLLGI